ncbi:KdsC family phosphatase [Alkalilimnicola sp. S0819]|uniref:KdsC family phosphatase n=1 Tax=Alkalilimnicola sp. S0819 TaxID=2613922 RepID=UPI001261E561|nr:HAD-IIIA family hydrolase [Alkalilimnicola sp. S0819]KAB7623825.1 HAD-IIIA family hydrolase [Alkalilimnicola sp. S0819]MPQ16700.1 HAD-IIIA family hydrolase [Alkalilimnicola sp. S0819]
MTLEPTEHAFCGAVDETLLARARPIKILVMDVDGVLTDGRINMGAEGELHKAFNILDGKGLSMLREAGVERALLTGRNSPQVQRRAEELGIQHVLQGKQRKWEALEPLLRGLALAPEHCAYIGDDLIDLPVARRVGLAVAVPNAHPWLAAHCHWQTRLPGGEGAVRELCELILLARGELGAMLQAYAQD